MLPDENPAATAAVTPEQPTETPAAPETPAVSPDELNALKRQLAEAERARKRLEDQQKKASEEEAAKQGEWQKLAEERSAELARERERSTRVEREQRITRLAARMKFIDPQDAVYRVQGEDGDSEDAAMAALQRIVEQSPHLVQQDPPARPEIGQVHSPSIPGAPGGPPDGKPPPPAGKAPLLSLAETDAMSTAEVAERMDEVDWLIAHQ